MLTNDGRVEIAVVSSTADGTVALRDPFELGGRNGGDAPGDPPYPRIGRNVIAPRPRWSRHQKVAWCG